jgi:hypothetical protein
MFPCNFQGDIKIPMKLVISVDKKGLTTLHIRGGDTKLMEYTSSWSIFLSSILTIYILLSIDGWVCKADKS